MLFWFAWLGRGTYNLLQRLHSRPAGNVALTFLCIYPEFIHHSIEPLSLLPTAALLLSALNVTLAMVEGRRGALKLGFILGALVLLRPASLLLILFIPVWLFFQGRKLFAPVVAAGLAIALTWAWVHWVSGQRGHFVPVNEANARNFYLGNNPWTPDYKTWYLGSHWSGEAEVDPAFRKQLDSLDALPAAVRGKAFGQAAWAHIRAQPARFALRSANRLRVTFAFDSFTGARLHPPHGEQVWAARLVLGLDAVLFSALLFGFLLMAVGFWKHEIARGPKQLILLVCVVYILPYMFSFSHPTYHLPLVPLMLGLAAVPAAKGITPMGRRLRISSRRAWLMAILLLMAVLALQVEWILQMRA
jgi:hypothetical protein